MSKTIKTILIIVGILAVIFIIYSFIKKKDAPKPIVQAVVDTNTGKEVMTGVASGPSTTIFKPMTPEAYQSIMASAGK